MPLGPVVPSPAIGCLNHAVTQVLTQRFTAAELNAVCAPVAVAIGIVVTYLTLDRFRYQRRIIDIAKKLGTVIDPPDKLLVTARETGKLTQVESNFLALHYLCGTADIADEVKKYKAVVLNGGLDSLLRWLLTFLVFWKVDRKIAGAVCALLCLIELVVSYVLFKTESPPQWTASTAFRWAWFTLVCAAYFVPALSTLVGESVIGIVNRSVKRWTNEEVTRQERGAGQAAIASLPQA